MCPAGFFRTGPTIQDLGNAGRKEPSARGSQSRTAAFRARFRHLSKSNWRARSGAGSAEVQSRQPRYYNRFSTKMSFLHRDNSEIAHGSYCYTAPAMECHHCRHGIYFPYGTFRKQMWTNDLA
jgi:hypothetical protein